MFSGPFTEDAADYYANPFRKQDAINQANLDAILDQVERGDETQQMIERMAVGYGGEGPAPGLTQSQIDFLESETPGARDARMQQISNLLTPAFLGANPFNLNTFLGIPQGSSIFSGLFGIPAGAIPAPVVDMATYSPAAAAEAAASLSSSAGNTGLGGLAGVDTGDEGISVI